MPQYTGQDVIDMQRRETQRAEALAAQFNTECYRLNVAVETQLGLYGDVEFIIDGGDDIYTIDIDDLKSAIFDLQQVDCFGGNSVNAVDSIWDILDCYLKYDR